MITYSRVRRSGIERSLRSFSMLLIDSASPPYAEIHERMEAIKAGVEMLAIDTAPEGVQQPAAETLRLLTALDPYAISQHQPMRDIAVGRSLTALGQLRDLRHVRRAQG